MKLLNWNLVHQMPLPGNLLVTICFYNQAPPRTLLDSPFDSYRNEFMEFNDKDGIIK